MPPSPKFLDVYCQIRLPKILHQGKSHHLSCATGNVAISSKIKNGCFSRKLEKGIVTFVLADAAWVFFASDSLHHACDIFRQMVTSFQTTSIYEIGLDRGNWFILCFGILLLFVVDVIHEKDVSVFQFVQRQTVLFRWTLYLGLIWSIILFGIYGAGYDSSQFIYFQF